MSRCEARQRHNFADPKFGAAVVHLEKAYAISRKHQAVATEAYAKYGEKGPLISGVMQDHWPKEVKEQLRALCDEMNWHSNRADECRPAGVRGTTMRALRNFIRDRDGRGRYL